MTETDIKIIIAAELKKQGFDKAQKATSGLDKSFKKLGATLAAAFSVQKIIAFGKASVKAFEEDERAARRLTQTLTNMGLAFEDPRMKTFINNLESTSGVLDDKLRPAMQSLLTTTGSVTKSQELLTLALDVAAGTGEDVVSVAQDLSRAYVGNTKGLAKYNLGLTKTELSSKSFAEVQEIISKQFSGQNAAYLETYSGKVALLNVAYANMQETVGKSLVDAFSLLAGKDGIAGATQAMEDFGFQIADTISGITYLIDKINSIPGAKTLLQGFNMSNFGILGVFQALGEEQRTKPKPFTTGMSVSGATDLYTKQERDRKKAEQAAIKRAKELAALQKKAELERIKREKEALQLKRAGTIFDMENIQIVAAMQGKVDAEQRLRLTALLAINQGNAEVAEKLSTAVLATNAAALKNLGIMMESGDSITDVITKIINAQAKMSLLALGIGNIPKAKNPFEDWPDIIAAIIAQINALATKIGNIGTPKTSTTTITENPIVGNNVVVGNNNNAGSFTVPNPFNPSAQPISTSTIANQINTLTALRAETETGTAINFLLKEHIDTLASATTLSSLNALGDEQARLRAMGVFDTPGIISGSLFDPSRFRRRDEGAPVTVIVQGSVIAQQDLTEIITDELYNYQKAGKSILYDSVSI